VGGREALLAEGPAPSVSEGWEAGRR
jgi:hypothetical protein